MQRVLYTVQIEAVDAVSTIKAAPGLCASMETYKLEHRKETQIVQMSVSCLQAGEAGKRFNRNKKTLQFTPSTQKKDGRLGLALCFLTLPQASTFAQTSKPYVKDFGKFESSNRKETMINHSDATTVVLFLLYVCSNKKERER